MVGVGVGALRPLVISVLLLPYLVGGERKGGLSGDFLERLGLESFDQSSNRGLREAS